MKANKKTLMALKTMLQNEQEYYDFEGMVSAIVDETALLKIREMGEHTLATDECAIEWDGNDVCTLSDFLESFSNIFLEKICNMIDSFVEDEIDCYFEEK
jgi:hypothetical protein